MDWIRAYGDEYTNKIRAKHIGPKRDEVRKTAFRQVQQMGGNGIRIWK